MVFEKRFAVSRRFGLRKLVAAKYNEEMENRRESDHTSLKSSLQGWLQAGAIFVALAAGLVAVAPRAVLADAMLSHSSATASPLVPATSATPASLLQQKPTAMASASLLRGIASWYGDMFNGRLTASGEKFDMYAMTACHPTLPFGSLVRVVDLENHRSVVVRITDRGELYQGRIIDLSYGAAQKLAMIKPGLAAVKLEVLSLGDPNRGK
ncbi:MAG: septal ring lytic transglycosylase RlpA family protein [Terracidiphilus sp.]